MGVGKFRTRVVFQTRGTTLDSLGQQSTTLTTLLTMGGDVRELSGNDRQNYSRGVETIEEFLDVRVPYRTALSNLSDNAVVQVAGDNYAIVGRSQSFSGINQHLRFILRREP